MVEARHALVLGEFGSSHDRGRGLGPPLCPGADGVHRRLRRHYRAWRAKETVAARQFFDAMGVAPDRFIYEDRSRNTAENAVFTKELVKPETRGDLAAGDIRISTCHAPWALSGGLVSMSSHGPPDYRTTGKPDELWEPIPASQRRAAAIGHRHAGMDRPRGLPAERQKSDALLPGYRDAVLVERRCSTSLLFYLLLGKPSLDDAAEIVGGPPVCPCGR